ncbi:ABATE domain-containing protein [Streptomyces lancefieldiae]|uniref:ABATE domain-containing protein n=1 Tax=Streptomyces lancefieldiae TaxID=3075520 RepID=A0ABU3ALG6_9ACTN|nr:ABATE domain-containing protein [Streptomyces sp. DSM 40712]MDT0611036.1 ABATE domain-containing protein [Streptomyces sp. DSM 40712]
MDETLATEITRTALPPAPGSERYRCLDFADTAAALPAGQSYDLLAAPESAMRWLAARDLTTPGVQLYEVCAQRMRTLRAHVRALFAARVDNAVPPEASLRAVNEALTAVPTAPLLAWDGAQGLRRVQAHPTDQAVNHALATLAADAADLLTGPDAGLLAACGSAPCDRFLLRTHGRRHWCSTRCGDRARAARAYARRSGASD